MDKIKEFFSKDNMTSIMNVCKKHLNYIVAGIGLICVILLLVFGFNGNQGKGAAQDTEKSAAAIESEIMDYQFTGETNTLEDKTQKKIEELIQNYYTAYAAGDVDSLEQYADPISDGEKSFISEIISSMYESISNVTCYVQEGYFDDSYFVVAVYDIKFYEVDTVAPAMDFFYVAKNSEGNLCIDNRYCSYNLNEELRDYDLDSNILSLINKYTAQEFYQNLLTDTNTRYTAAIDSDENLKKKLTTDFEAALKQWYIKLQEIKAQQDTENSTEHTTEQTTEQTSESQPAASESEAQTPETPADNTTQEPAQEETPQPYTVVTTDIVNVRATPDANGELLGKLTSNVTLTAYGTEGEWTKVQYSGSSSGYAYIKTDLLSQ